MPLERLINSNIESPDGTPLAQSPTLLMNDTDGCDCVKFDDTTAIPDFRGIAIGSGMRGAYVTARPNTESSLSEHGPLRIPALEDGPVLVHEFSPMSMGTTSST